MPEPDPEKAARLARTAGKARETEVTGKAMQELLGEAADNIDKRADAIREGAEVPYPSDDAPQA